MSTTETQATGTEITIAPTVSLEALEKLELLAGECQKIQERALSALQRTFTVANAMRQLTELITDEMMVDIMALHSSPSGFKTDKDQEGTTYDVKTVKRCMIEATLRGLRMVDNEVNIIKGNMYAAQAGMKRLVEEWPGMDYVRIDVKAPIPRDGYDLVPCVAKYSLEGEEKTLRFLGDSAIPVRRNKDQIIDATIGKAKRKLYARIYDTLTGTEQGLIETDEADLTASGEIIDATSEPTSDPEEQANLVQGYKKRFFETTDSKDVRAIQKEAVQSGQLSPESIREVNDAANERCKVLKK